MANRIQEWFNKQVRVLSARGWTRAGNSGFGCSYRGGFVCSYRDESGNRCAVGLLLPDNCDPPAGAVLSKDVRPVIDTALNPTEEEWSFLQRTQDAHDIAITPERMRARFRYLGANMGLEWPTEVSRS